MCVCDVQVVPAVTFCVCVCLFCSVFKTCLPTAIRHLSIWNIWKAPSQKQRMTNFASLTLCLLVVFLIMFISTCLMLVTVSQNGSQVEYKYGQPKQTRINLPKDDVPLSSGIQTPEPMFQAELMLLSSVALFSPVTWFLEYLARLQCKQTKRKVRQTQSDDDHLPVLKTQITPSCDRVYGPRAHIFQLCCAHPSSPTVSLTDIQVDSKQVKEEVVMKSSSEGLSSPRSDIGKTSTQQGPSPKSDPASNTSVLTSVCSVFNWRAGLTRENTNIRGLIQKRLQDILHDTSVYVKMKFASRSQQGVSKSDSQTDGITPTSSSKWSQVSAFWKKPGQSAETINQKIKCALCKGRKFIYDSSKKAVHNETSELIKSVAKQSVDMVIKAVKAGDLLKEGTKRIKGSVVDKVLKVLESAGIAPEDTHSSATCMLRTKTGLIRTRKSSSDSCLFWRSNKLANIPGCNSDIATTFQRTKCTFTGSSSSSSITLATDLRSTISSYLRQSMTNLMGVLSRELQGESDKLDHTSSSCSKAESSACKSEVPMNKEEINSAASSTLKAASQRNTIEVNAAVINAIKNFAGATADQVLDVIMKAITKPFMAGSHFVPDTIEQQNLVQQVALLIQHHHDLIAFIRDELLMQAYAKQYANTIVANTVVKARFELTEGSWVFTEKDEIAKRLKRGATEAIRRMFVETTKNKAKLEKILGNRKFEIKMINAVISYALRSLEEQRELEDKFEHSCCCDLVNKVHMLATQDDKALTETNILDSINDNLLRNLTYEAAEHLGEDMASLMFDIADFNTVAHIAKKGVTESGFAIEPCLQSMAQVLVQISKDLDVSI